MSNNTKADSKALRLKIADCLNSGKGIRETARECECSTRTVQKVRDRMDDPETPPDFDRRTHNSPPDAFSEATKEAIYIMRQELNLGSRLLHSLLLRDPEKFGIYDRSQIPSTATIHKWLVEKRMTKKTVGKNDKRGFPIDFADQPGIVAFDEWGPRIVRGERVFLVTCQDRYTRLVFGLPMLRKGTMRTWMKAYDIASKNLLAGAFPDAIWIDNGIGMALAHGHTSQATRYMMKHGSRIAFNAPHAPWKNGRLENWHHRMEDEYWRHVDQKTSTIPEALHGLLGWINYYNMDRPQSGLRDKDGKRLWDKSPADLASWYLPLDIHDFQDDRREYEELEPQDGIIDMVRMVRNSGLIELQERDTLKVSPIFAGQYLRVRFHCRANEDFQQGEVIWQRGQKKLPLTVATFTHQIDRKRRKGIPLCSNVRNVDFDTETEGFKQATALDEFQFDKAAARIGKRTRTANRTIDEETGEVK